jgi:hypothetical protein
MADLTREAVRNDGSGATQIVIDGPDSKPKRINLEELSDADAQLAAQFG